MDTQKQEDQIAYENRVAEVRASLLGVEEAIKGLKTDPFLDRVKATAQEGVDSGEIMANATIAYRSAEDARMRLGKVFQAMNGGVSSNTR